MKLQQAIEWQHAEKLFVSLSAKPGKTGEQFYNTLFKHHNINAEYVACECIDLAEDMKLVREHCAGASISMPYKKQVEEHIDMSWSGYTPVNTVINDNKFLRGYNCDLMGLKDLLKERTDNKRILVLGDGAMAENINELCVTIESFTVASRRKNTWDLRHDPCDILINTTSIGMNSKECPVDKISADLVVDCVIGDTELIRAAHAAGKAYITGAEIYVAQFKYQFKAYTGIDPDVDLVKLVAKKVFDV
jgi:shikimate dehydrogenase